MMELNLGKISLIMLLLLQGGRVEAQPSYPIPTELKCGNEVTLPSSAGVVETEYWLYPLRAQIETAEELSLAFGSLAKEISISKFCSVTTKLKSYTPRALAYDPLSYGLVVVKVTTYCSGAEDANIANQRMYDEMSKDIRYKIGLPVVPNPALTGSN